MKKDEEDGMFSKQETKEIPQSIMPKLREITGELARDPMTKVFKTIGGKDAIARSLLARTGVGVVDMSIPEGEVFPEHGHSDPIIEYLVVYEGRVSVLCTADGIVVEKGEGEICTITDEASHVVTAIKGYGDVRLVGITIPRDPSFPGELEE